LKPPSRALSRQEIGILFLVGLVVLLGSAALMALNYFALNGLGRGGDLLVLWSGGRAFLFEHTEPYGGSVPAEVQELVYERPARAGEEPYILNVPFNLLILFFPFAVMPSPLFARAAFSLVSEAGLVGLIFFSLRLGGWQPRPLLGILLLAVSGLSFYSIEALTAGSPSILLGLAYAGVLFALETERYELAGGLLAVSFFRWELGGPLLLLLTMRVLHFRRWRVLAGFAMLSFILLTVSLLSYPGWIVPFLRAVLYDLRTPYGISTRLVFDNFAPGHGSVLAWGLTALMIGILAYEWGAARGADPRRFYWAACVTMSATPLLGQRTEIENLAVLILPWGLILSTIQERWARAGIMGVVIVMLFLLIGPWLLFTRGLPVVEVPAMDALFLFLPATTLLGMFWMRWWALRPPRTWADRMASLSQERS